LFEEFHIEECSLRLFERTGLDLDQKRTRGEEKERRYLAERMVEVPDRRKMVCENEMREWEKGQTKKQDWSRVERSLRVIELKDEELEAAD